MKPNLIAACFGLCIGAFVGGSIAYLSGIPVVWGIFVCGTIGFLLGLTEDL